MSAVNTIRQEISTILENTYMEIDIIETCSNSPLQSVPQPLTTSTPFIRTSSSRTSSMGSLSSEGSESSEGFYRVRWEGSCIDGSFPFPWKNE